MPRQVCPISMYVHQGGPKCVFLFFLNKKIQKFKLIKKIPKIPKRSKQSKVLENRLPQKPSAGAKTAGAIGMHHSSHCISGQTNISPNGRLTEDALFCWEIYC